MAGQPKHFLTDEEIITAVLETGSLVGAADSLGVPRPTLDSIVGQRNLRGRCAEARKHHAIGARTPTDPEADVSQEEILRDRNRELEDRLRRGRKKDVFEERILNALSNAALERKPVYSPRVVRSHRSRSKHEFVLLWSDAHAGEVVSREETNGIGTYDWNIMLKRHDKLRDSVLSYQENRPYPVETLHIFALGDMVGGAIHDELAETNEFPVAEVTVQAGLDFAAWLEQFVPHFKRIRVSGVGGNHGRMHHKPRAKQPFDSFDWIAYHTMRVALRKYPSIEFDIPKSAAWPVTVAEQWRCLLFHGDGVRSSMPGVPWGGVARRVSALQDQYTQAGMPVDLYCCGHFHTANVVESSAGRIAMNGSIKGVDEYSLKQFGGGRKAQQLLLTFHPRNGLTDVSFVDLEDTRPAALLAA